MGLINKSPFICLFRRFWHDAGYDIVPRTVVRTVTLISLVTSVLE